MCRVTWPLFVESDVWEALEERKSEFKRICLQVVNRPGCFATAQNWLEEIRSRCDLPVSVEIRTEDSRMIGDLIRSGANCIGLPIDVASERLYSNLRGGELKEALSLLISAARSFPGMISTHIIVGLGETDREIVEICRKLSVENIPIALFAFTPCKGTRLESKEPPRLERYRRIQVATYLISQDPRIELEYDQNERLILPSLQKDSLLEIIPKALLTRGCDGCNRPFYNERPGCTPYNYPEELDDERIAKEAEVMLT